MKCSLCDSRHLDRVADTDSKSGLALDVFLCGSCGLIQQAPLPSEEELKQYYATDYRIDYKRTRYPKPKHVFRSARLASQRLNFLRAAGVRPTTLLDIGAGSGEFVALASRAGFRAEGVEPNQGYSEYARSQYEVPVSTGDLDDITSCHEVVTMFHVLEHLRSPADVFSRLHSLLKPGGRLFIEVPWALAGSIAPSNRYFKAHLYYFDVETLAAAASRHFDVVAVEANGNLRMLLEPRPVPGSLRLPPEGYADSARERLSRHGWLHYLTSGGGWLKPAGKIQRLIREQGIRHLSGKQILAMFAEPSHEGGWTTELPSQAICRSS